jgi:hypothetical protein
MVQGSRRIARVREGQGGLPEQTRSWKTLRSVFRFDCARSWMQMIGSRPLSIAPSKRARGRQDTPARAPHADRCTFAKSAGPARVRSRPASPAQLKGPPEQRACRDVECTGLCAAICVLRTALCSPALTRPPIAPNPSRHPPRSSTHQPCRAPLNSRARCKRAPQLHRWAVITHSVPIIPPGLQLLRRLLTR